MKSYLIGLLATILVVLLRSLLDHWLGPAPHFLLPLTLPPMLAAVSGGLRPGLVTTLLNFGVGILMLKGPTAGALHRADAVRLLILLANGFFVSWLCERAHHGRRQLETRVEANARKYEAIFNTQLHFIGLLSTDGRVTDVNESALKVAQVTRGEVIGKLFWETPWWSHDPRVQQRQRESVEKARNGESVRFETTYAAGGEIRWADFSLTPYYNEQGTLVWLIPEGHDITGPKTVEQTLQIQTDSFRNAFDYAPIGMAQVGAQGQWLRVNRAICELVGYSEEELLKLDFQAITHPEDLDKDLSLMHQVLTGELHTYHIEKRYFHKQGHIIYIQLFVSLVRDPAGKPLYFISQIQDVTARKLTQDRLKASLHEKEVMLREIHHRVKNNLQLVSTLLYLQSDHTEDPAAAEMFKESQDRIKSMALIHERLYRSDDLDRVDFGEYLASLADDLLANYQSEDQDIRVDLAVSVPNVPIDTAIPCGLLINELISNCLKHGLRNREKGVIQVSMKTVEAQVQLRIADDGIGFPENLDFRQTSTFGLQIVQTLTDQLGGTIDLLQGKGTCFEILFPMWRHEAEALA
ncbi:MAG: PAS domain S-box protein [Candidatus Eremiobacteraeota bacterium]|nr:PAS domain S-box protein [Candidatus Eremiobacteraeota bacterium]